MASFSPAPRRSSRLGTVATNHRPSSRFPTPIREVNRVVSNGSQQMDVDEVTSVLSDRSLSFRSTGEAIFAKSEQLSVSFYADLPVEVSQVLKNADFYRDSYAGCIDTLTGFALVASIQTCFVWQHAQALKSIPTCYIFACPADLDPPFHGLFPHGSSREPGLVLVSSSGEIRFWDSIGIGLAGGEHYSTSNLGLSADEVVTNLIRADSQSYIASTSFGLLFRLALTAAGGKHQLAVQPFSRPVQAKSFTRLFPSLFSQASVSLSSTPEPGNISSVALGPRNAAGGRELWALVDSRLQKWDMKPEGWEELVMDEDIIEIVRSALRDSVAGIERDNSKLDLELVDLATEVADLGDVGLVILASYAGAEDDNSMALDIVGVRRLYVLVHLTHELSGIFGVRQVRPVPYQSTSSSGAPMHPRIQVLAEGQLVGIQFGDAVALVARDSAYSDRMELKSSTDRTLGVGVVQSDTSLIILTAATMMKATVDVGKLLAFDSTTGRADLVKSTMTQAILYGSSPNNPLHFSFPPEVDEESLMRGAEQLSDAILRSNPDLVRKTHDLSAQLVNRKERLSWLIRFINDNAALEKMSQKTRQRLAGDAEKLYACHQLWIQHNELLSTAPSFSVLNDVVYAYMSEIQEGHHEDFMRAFFRLHVGDIGLLIDKVPGITINTANETGRSVVNLLPEANQIILTVLKSAFEYREYNSRVYGIHMPMLDPWTSTTKIIDVLNTLFETSAKVVSGQGSDVHREGDPYMQLPDLASSLFAAIQERLDWLGSSSGRQDGHDREKHELERRLASLRPDVLETLRVVGHEAASFSLAEKYRDFSSLADLCHRDTVYPPEQNPNAHRIEAYIERFKEDFTTELYRWYIQHGELRVMFAQGQTHNRFLDSFFAKNSYPSISWINDLGNGWHDAAARVLLSEAGQASHLAAKQLMLSVGKLSHLAQLQSDPTGDENLLDAFHDDLDFVSVHEALLGEFQTVLGGLRGRQSLDSQVDAITNEIAANLAQKPALALVFKTLVRQLLQGRVLSVEDVVDVLTLKDNIDTLEDYATALQLLVRDQTIPESRKPSAFYSVWRRVYIHDDWQAIRSTSNISDEQVDSKYRGSALYATLRSVLARDEPQSDGYITTPNIALIVPSSTQIASRWPGKSSEEIEDLAQDYNFEMDKLGDMELTDIFERLKDIALQDYSWEHGEDMNVQ
ncbi:hypothetical protein C8J56DRAFT_955381 [Mycena floridula]|nr:hypothetical protein C8J56DRAFT_955381 [Mycena floridula]